MKLSMILIVVPSDFKVTIHMQKYVLNLHVQDIKQINLVLTTNKHRNKIFAGLLFIIGIHVVPSKS